MRRQMRLPALLAVMSLLAACGGTAGPAGSQAAASTVGAVSAAPPPPSSAPLKIGAILPLTGSQASVGLDSKKGISLYLDSVHNQLGGRNVEIVYADSQYMPDVGLTVAKRLVESDHVQAIMGLISTAVCNAVVGYTKQVKMPTLLTADCASQGLTTDPQFANPYLIRLSVVNSEISDPAADWAINNGHRKAILVAADYGGGIEFADLFASAFVARGGTIVQEMYPKLGTTDFGPFLSQLDRSADLLVTFVPGAPTLIPQYRQYVGAAKPLFMDLGGVQLSFEDKNGSQMAGIVASTQYTQALDTPANHAFLQAFRAKYPNETPGSHDIALNYAGLEVLNSALKGVQGDIEHKQQQFLDSLQQTHVDTARGPVSLDDHHDIVIDDYIIQMDASSSGGVTQKLLQTYPRVSQFWDRTPDQLAKFPYGKDKDKWVGMTKEKLGDVITTPK